MNEKEKKLAEIQVTDYAYITSSIGNCYFSGLSMLDLWNSISISENREELDAAIDALIKIKEIDKKY